MKGRKQPLISMIACLLLVAAAARAQAPVGCLIILDKARLAFEQGNYREAFDHLLNLEECDYEDRFDEARKYLQLDIFNAVDSLKAQAEYQRDKARRLQRDAENARQVADSLRRDAESYSETLSGLNQRLAILLDSTEQEKQRAERLREQAVTARREAEAAEDRARWQGFTELARRVSLQSRFPKQTDTLRAQLARAAFHVYHDYQDSLDTSWPIDAPETYGEVFAALYFADLALDTNRLTPYQGGWTRGAQEAAISHLISFHNGPFWDVLVMGPATRPSRWRLTQTDDDFHLRADAPFQTDGDFLRLAIARHPTDGTVATGGYRRTELFPGGSTIGTSQITPEYSVVHQLAFSGADGSLWVRTGQAERALRRIVLDTVERNGAPQSTLVAGDVCQFALTDEHAWAITTGGHVLRGALDADTLQLLTARPLALEGACPTALAVKQLGPDSVHFALGLTDGRILLLKAWTSERPFAPAALKLHRARVADLAFSPDGRRLATCGYDQRASLLLLDAPAHLPGILYLDDYADRLTSITFLNSSKLLLGDRDGSIYPVVLDPHFYSRRLDARLKDHPLNGSDWNLYFENLPARTKFLAGEE